MRIFGYKNTDSKNFSSKFSFKQHELELIGAHDLQDLFSQAMQREDGLFCQASMLHSYHYQISFKLHIIPSTQYVGCFELRFFEINNKGVDPITDLPNGWAITSQYQHDLNSRDKNNIHLAYLIFSVDNFSSVNFHYGYHVGDQYLMKIGQLIQNLIGDFGFVVRYHNSRFGILLRDTSGQPQANFEFKVHTLVNELMALFDKAIFINDDIAILRTFSLGVAINWLEFNSFFEMDSATEKAYFMAKARGDSAMYFASKEYAKERILQKSITDLLPKAIKELEIDIHFQPQINLESQQLIGFEVLARWSIEGTGYISPLDFVSTAARLGLNVELDMCILKKACLQINRWHAAGYVVPRVAVNMSAKTLESKFLVDQIVHIINQTQCLAEHIEIEITETDKLTDSLAFIKNLKKLKQLGFAFSMDDFGTGYSSLSLVRTCDFALNKIKLDIEFTEKVCHSLKDQNIIKQIIELSESLGIDVLAEGVEYAEQVEALANMGCDYGQGYYFSKPLLADDASAFMTRSPVNLA